MCSNGKLPTTSSHEHKAGLRMLGWNIAHLGPWQQFTLVVAAAIGCNLVYGMLQEYLVVHVFKRRLGVFMSLLQTISFALYAHLQRLHLRETHVRRIPLRAYALLAFTMAAVLMLGNLGVAHLNYAAKTLFKSTKAVPMMLWGAQFLGKKYSARQYASVGMMVLGLALFLTADAATPAMFSAEGVMIMLACVFMDCWYSNLAELLLARYDATPEELVFFTYSGAAAYLAAGAVLGGDLSEGVHFIAAHHGWAGMGAIAAYAAAGYCGATCTTAVTKTYGALTSTLTSASRKALNLLLSFALFPKPFSASHGAGAALFMAGLLSKALSKQHRGNNAARHGGSRAGANATPEELVQFVELAAMDVDALEAGGKGGGGCGGGGGVEAVTAPPSECSSVCSSPADTALLAGGALELGLLPAAAAAAAAGGGRGEGERSSTHARAASFDLASFMRAGAGGAPCVPRHELHHE